MVEFIVKSEEVERAQEALFRDWQDGVLGEAGVSRHAFRCFAGVRPEDETVVVWAEDYAEWTNGIPPANLLLTEYSSVTGHWEYTFARIHDRHEGGPYDERPF